VDRLERAISSSGMTQEPAQNGFAIFFSISKTSVVGNTRFNRQYTWIDYKTAHPETCCFDLTSVLDIRHISFLTRLHFERAQILITILE